MRTMRIPRLSDGPRAMEIRYDVLHYAPDPMAMLARIACGDDVPREAEVAFWLGRAIHSAARGPR
jgi:hypothetical protein